MTYGNLQHLLLEYPGSSLCFPFDKTTAVFKVGKKMFALVALDSNPLSINLKCDPDDAQILRSQFESIIPGYHMNKDHWNTVFLDGSIASGLVSKLIYDSYTQVVKTMSKKEQKRLGLFGSIPPDPSAVG